MIDSEMESVNATKEEMEDTYQYQQLLGDSQSLALERSLGVESVDDRADLSRYERVSDRLADALVRAGIGLVFGLRVLTNDEGRTPFEEGD